jgi:large subunit ribosomal protein L7/L12
MALLTSKNLKFFKLINSNYNKSLIKTFTNTKFHLNATASAAKQKVEPTIIAPPHLEGEPKVYQPKIQNIVNEITKLTLIEVSDLNELLRKTLNIKDVAMFSAGPSQAQSNTAAKSKEDEETEAAAAAAPVQQKSSFKVKLVKFDDTKKVALIKEVKSLNENMNLVQAKKFIEALPQVFRDNIGKDEAEKLKAQLEKVGATIVIE